MSYTLTNIEYKLSSHLLDEDPEKFIFEINGDIHLLNDDADKIMVGKVKYYFMDLMSAEGYNADILLDTYSNTAAFIGSLYRADGYSFKKKIENLAKFGIYNPNLLILDRLEILPEFRGNGFSSQIINDGTRVFGANAGLLVLKAFPLQLEYCDENSSSNPWKEKMSLDKLERNERIAFRKLVKFYSKLGFIKIEKNNIMIKIISDL